MVAPRASVAVAAKFTITPAVLVASTVMLVGNASAGGVVSRTVTVNVSAAVLPAASIAVAVTVDRPRGNVLPEGGANVTGTMPSASSVADALNVATAPAGLVASIVMFAG